MEVNWVTLRSRGNIGAGFGNIDASWIKLRPTGNSEANWVVLRPNG